MNSATPKKDFITIYSRRIRRVYEIISMFLRSAIKAPLIKHDIDNVETYSMFIGYPRSGSSMIGALLDAHPEMVFAHELNALRFIGARFSKRQLFYLLIEKSRKFAKEGNKWSDYSYEIKNLWKGTYNNLRVIGDKKAGDTAYLLRKHPDYLERLKSTVKVPIKIIHVIRNPYDVISTISIRRRRSIRNSIDYFFYRCESVDNIRKIFPNENFKDIHLESFIDDPKKELSSLCKFLGVSDTDDFITNASKLVFTSPQKSRSKVEWSDELINLVSEKAKKFKFLGNYNFKNG